MFLFVAEKYSTAYMYHNFLIFSVVNGRLGCFHVLAIINSAAVNIRVHVSFGIVVFSECMLKSGIVGSYDRFISSFFKECPYCLLQWLYHFTFPPTVQEGSLCSTSPPAFIVCWFFLMMGILSGVR